MTKVDTTQTLTFDEMKTIKDAVRAGADSVDYIEKNLESTRRAFEAGVKLGMGSDAEVAIKRVAWVMKGGAVVVDHRRALQR